MNWVEKIKGMSSIEDKVIRMIKDRAKRGKQKYGVTMDRQDLTLADWLQHLQEEMLDAAIYIEKIKDYSENYFKTPKK